MNKIVIGILGAIGLVMIVAGSVFLGVFPGILRKKVREELPIDDNSTDSYKRWEEFKAPVTMSFNFFTLKSGIDQHLSEIEFDLQGPYVYRETRRKVNVVYSNDSTKLSYNDFKTYEFDLQKSIGKEDQLVEFINFPTLGVMYNKIVGNTGMSIFTQIRKTLPENETSLFITRSVVDLLFNGVHFKLFENLFVQMFTKSDKYSIMKGKNMTEEQWVINTGKDDVDQLGQLIKFDKKPLLTNSMNQLIWKNDSCGCNNLNGTDGTFFKPNIQKDDILYAFEPQLCRTVFFHYWKETEVRDITTYRFVVPQEYFNSPNVTQTNECYHQDGIARFDSGLLNIALCDRRSLGAYIYMSEPYFIHGDESLRKQFKEELKPKLDLNDDNYGTYLDIEPNTGIVLKAVRRLQMNVRVSGNNLLFKNSKNDPLDYIVPVFWIEEVGEATEEQADELKSMLLNIKKIGNGVSIGVIVVGAIMTGVSVYFCIRS